MAGKNINQLNVTTTAQDTDLYYLGRSPYGANDDHSISWASIRTALNAVLQLASSAQVTGLDASLASKLSLSGGTLTGNLILNGDATLPLQAVALEQLNAVIAGLSVRGSCMAATTANLTATYNNGTSGVGATLTNSGTQVAFAVDGYTASVNDRILVKNQSTAAQNGIYIVTTVGSGSTNWVLTRATDYDQASEVTAGTYTVIETGTANAGTVWYQATLGTITVGTTSLVFSELFIVNAGTGLTKSGNTLSITNTGVSGSSAGSAASIPVITYNAQGQLLSVVDTPVQIAESNVTNLPTDLAGKQPLNSFLTSLGNIGPAPVGKLYKTGATTCHVGDGIPFSGTAFNNITNSANAGDQFDFTSASTKTVTLDITGLGTGFEFFIVNSGAGAINFTSASGSIYGLTSVPGATSAANTPFIRCAVIEIGGVVGWYIQSPQQLNANLTGLSALAVLGIVTMTAGGGFAARQLTSSSGQITFSNPDGILGNPDLSINLNSLRWQPVTESTTARTLSLTDVNVTISCTNNSADTTITIPTNASVAIPPGSQFKVINSSGGVFLTNVVAAGGVTVSPFTSIVLGNGGYVLLEKTGTDTWLILECYEQYTLTTNWSGIWSANQAGNCNITRNMNDIDITLPTVTAAQNAANHITSVTAFPARFRPTANTEIAAPSVNNGGTNTSGNGTVTSTGSIVIYAASYSNFSGTGTGGFNRQDISYTLS